MDEFAAGTDVTLTIDHSNNGVSLTVTALQYQVLDSLGNVLLDFTTAANFNPATATTDILIGRALNQTADKIDARQVNVSLVTASGTYSQSFFYKLVGDQTKLTPMVDSFMTFPESIIFRIKTTEIMESFDAMPDAIKAVALENAYKTIVKLRFIDPAYQPCSSSNYFDRDYGPDYYYGNNYYNQTTGIDISNYTQLQFNALPADMIFSLKKAQLLQANALVENSPVREKIRLGIISETIGDSSMFFKQSGTFATLGTQVPSIADSAYPYLKNWLYKTASSSQTLRIGRA